MIRIHEDAALFREAVALTQNSTTFSARLIEKDYFAAVALEYFAERNPELIFKGGTCLSKIHMDFFRLSEDLDFTIPMKLVSSRRERSKVVVNAKSMFASLPREISCFQIEEPLRGANNSTQYIGMISYSSVVSNRAEGIKWEISLREPLLLPQIEGDVRSILLDPVSRAPFVPIFKSPCISLTEAYAEKFRDALTRKDVAVRDFFDIDYAVRKGVIALGNKMFLGMIEQKIAVPGNATINVSTVRRDELFAQADSHLKAVLREQDFREFDVERAFAIVEMVAKRIGRKE